jgi:hypothetical protein
MNQRSENAQPQPGSFRIGPDCAIIQDDILHIYARRAIPDWTVREFQRQAIFFQGRKYYLRLAEAAPRPYAVRYELAPWPDDLHEQSKQSFAYDEAFVAERDRQALGQGARSLGRACLLPLYPFLGFLWSGFKDRALVPLGFIPASITSASTLLEFLLTILQGIFFGYLGGGFVAQALSRCLLRPGSYGGAGAVLDLALLALLAVDCMVRCSQVLRGDELPDGFLEWLFKPFRR